MDDFDLLTAKGTSLKTSSLGIHTQAGVKLTEEWTKHPHTTTEAIVSEERKL